MSDLVRGGDPSSNADYARLPSTESDPYASKPNSTSNAYNYDFEAGHAQRDLYRSGTSGGNRSGELLPSSSESRLSSAFAAATRLRGAKQKLLWLTAAVCLVYMV